MSSNSHPRTSDGEASKKPRSFLLLPFPDGRQLVQVDDLAISIPKYTGRYYHAKVTLRSGKSEVESILYNPTRQLTIDGEAYIDSVYILINEKGVPPITIDAILKVRILEELSQGEDESIANEITKMMRGEA
jgi:hypothetical protein